MKNKLITTQTKKIIWSLFYFGVVAGLILLFVNLRETLSDDNYLYFDNFWRILFYLVFIIAGAIGGFVVASLKFDGGCVFLPLGLLIGGWLGFGLLVFILALTWLAFSIAVLVLAIVFYRVVISLLADLSAIVLIIISLIIAPPTSFLIYSQTKMFYRSHKGTAFEFKQNDQGTFTLIGYSGGYIGKKEVVIPDAYNDIAVTEIGENAFKGKRLTSVTIPDSVISIGNYAFAENKLIDVTIGNSVTSIGDSAFAGTFKDWEFVGNQLTSVVIPDSVTAIGKSAFEYNQLTSVVIPDGVTAIGASAFAYNHLDNVSIPNSVTTIGSNAFAFNWLTSIVIPDNVITIRSGAFYNNALTSVVIPDSVREIGQGAFANNHVTSIRLGTNVELREAELRVGKPWFDVLGEVLGKGTRFNAAYSNNKKKAGTYTRSDTKSSSWKWKQ